MADASSDVGIVAAVLFAVHAAHLQPLTGASAVEIGGLYTVLAVAVLILRPIAVWGLDRIGRTPLMAAGLIISAVVSMLLPSLSVLLAVIVLFTVEQVGWSTANPAEAAMVADFVGQDVRGMGYAIYTLVIWGAHALGPLMGGWLYDTVGKAVPFYLNGGMLAVGAVLVLLNA